MFNTLHYKDWQPGAGEKSWRDKKRDIALDVAILEALDASPYCDWLSQTPNVDLVPLAALDYCGHPPNGMQTFDLLCWHAWRTPGTSSTRW